MTESRPHTHCPLCSTLCDEQYAFQKHGWEEGNSYLPAAAHQLITVRDLRPGSGRLLHLRQCPECHTFYLYRTDYEYLVNGTEDEEFLTRLSDEDAVAYLA